MATYWRKQSAPDERTPLISSNTETAGTLRSTSVQECDDHVPAKIAYRLYVSHFLSTWNSRVFEFGAVLYLASIYPGTLLPMSVYALSRGLAAILFAPAVGYYIDVGNRLQVVRLSIGGYLLLDRNRSSTNRTSCQCSPAASCCGCIMCYLLLASNRPAYA